MRVAFFGTPEVAVPSLQVLDDAEGIEVVVVVTNPDRPQGRSKQPVAPPVKQAALARGLEVRQPERPGELRDELAQLGLDVAAVVAYGAILPADLLAVPRHGFVNLHFSILPRWRGAAPVQHALRAGDETTGLTTFVLDEGMDTGPILDRVEISIHENETAGELLERLAEEGAPVLLSSVRRLVAGFEPTPQPDGATLAPKITPADVAIDWTATAREVKDLIRSANPAPGAHTTFRGERLKIWRTTVTDASGPAGQFIDGSVVACGEGAVTLVEVQPAGKARMDGTAFVNGYDPEPGEQLGQ